MKINTEMDHWKDIFQQKVKDFQPEGVSPDWNSFENKLNHKSSSSWGSRHWMIAAAGVVAILLPISFWILSDPTQPNPIVSEQAVLPENSIQPTKTTNSEPLSTNHEKKQSATQIALQTEDSHPILSDDAVLSESIIPDDNHIRQHEVISNGGTQEHEKSNKDSHPVLVSTFKLTVNEPCTPASVSCIPDVISSFYFYSWTTSDGQSSNETQPTFTFMQAGQVSISLVVNYRDSKKSNQNKESQFLSVYSRPESDFIVEQEKLHYTFRPKESGNALYMWKIADLSSEETEISYAFVKSGIYHVELFTESAEGCQSKTNKEIKVEVIHPIFIGNAFTPDGDGNNDFFGPKSEALIDFEYQFEVYNRINQLIFVSTDPFVLWDGKIMGIDEALEGFYLYKIYTKDKYGNSQVKTGDVLLIRRK